MKRIAISVIASVMAAAVLTGCGAASLPTESSDETAAKELPPPRAQDDYYRFINQDRFDTSEIEYGDKSVELAFNSKPIDEQIGKIIDDVAAGSGYAPGSEEDIIKHAYDYFMDYDFETEPIPEDLMAVIKEIDSAATVDELLEVEAKMIRDYGTNGIISVSIDNNYFNPQEKIIYINQLTNVLGTSFVDIRDRQYALDGVMDDAKVIMSTQGYDKETSEQIGKELAYLTLDLYGETDLEVTEALMDFEYMKVYSADQVNEILSNIDINKYLTTIGINSAKLNSFILTDVDQIRALNSILVDENINALKAWELGNLYGTYGRYIAPHYSQLAGMVGRNYDSMHDQAIDEVMKQFGDETDPIYVERYYTNEMDEALRSMCDDIREGYRKLISGADWLSEPTRKELLQKLENIVYVTGTDLKRHDNSKYADIYGDNYYELCLNYNRIKTQKSIESLNEPVSRLEITMPMQMMNACYHPAKNNITITVAITNAPFFDVNADYYTNLGGLGMIIAHEMGHAFDSNCILFNSKGEFDPSWISDSDMQTLLARNEKAVSYFEENFTVFGVYHVDGEKTLGENYADLGAVECIVSLTKSKDDRIKLFESYATIWCSMQTDDMVIMLLAHDEHSPDLVRVNAVLSSIDEFYETYDVREGDGMYIAPENRISRWY